MIVSNSVKQFLAGVFCASVLFCVVGFVFIFPDSSGQDNGIVKKRIDLISNELVRIKRYETQVRERLSIFDQLIQDAVELDHNKVSTPTHDTTSHDSASGVGGGDEGVRDTFANAYRPVYSVNGKFSSASLLDVLDFESERIRSVPMGAPVEGRVTSGFGKRRSPFARRWQQHRGIDFGVDWRTPVVAPADGTVIKAGRKGAYGRTILIDHGNGIETLYAHLSRIHVKVGQKVCRGQRIGLVGSTGRSTGPHLHYEVWVDGERRDPAPFIELAHFLKYIEY